MDLRSYIFVDQHAHPLTRNQMEMDGFSFRQCFTESRSRSVTMDFVPDSLHYTDMINQLGALFGTEGEGEILSLRSNQERTEYIRMLLDSMSFGALLIDDGYAPSDMMPLAQMASISARPVFKINRIEQVLEDSIANTSSFDELASKFAQMLVAETAGGGGKPVAFKTIMGYRGGLQLDIVSQKDAEADYPAVVELFKDSARRRIERRPLYHYFLMQAFELAACHGLPVQVHTGLGDDDAELIKVNPALMQPLFKMQSLSHTKFVLLHCYPYVREAAIMAALYPNVYFDLSLSVNLVSARAADLILEGLACAPSTKLLAGSDGHTCVEALWYGALCWKRGLSLALDKLISEEYLSFEQAEVVAANVLHGNAIRLYQLEGLA